MATKTNKGLVAYAKEQIGKPYWFGSFGQAGSSSLLTQKARQYPTEYTAANVERCKKQFGVKVHDCIGLIKGYLWSDSPTDTTPTYNPAQDLSANGMYNACKSRGYINTMPDVAGVLVFMSGHVGVYIGNGEVIEAMNFNRGVVKTKLAGRGWQRWGKCPFISYETQTTTPKPTATTPAGNKETAAAKVGEKVTITGNYASSSSAATAGNSKAIGTTAYIVKVYEGRAFPYQLGKKAGDTSSANTIGFAKASAFKIGGSSTAAPKKPTVGAKVKLTGKYASSSTAKSAGNSKAIGTTAYIVKVYEGKAFPYQIGTKKGNAESANTIGFAKASAFELL